MTAREPVDVAVVGAGAVGATAALALAQAGRRVVVVDGRPGPAACPGDNYAEFVVSLNRASSNILDRLGVWAPIVEQRVSPYIGMALEDSVGGGHTQFDSADIGEPVLGHFVENALIEAVLHRALAAEPRIELRWGVRAASLEADFASRHLELDDGSTLAARLIVGADGGRSRLRDLAGITVQRYDYEQRALVCNFATEQAHGAIARQRFLPGGPVAMLPLADGRCSLAWFRPPEEAEELLALSDTSFCERLGEATGYTLGAVTAATPRYAPPIARQHAARYTAERIALIGDAAHTIHPLAGQGLNLGLLDAAALAAAIGGSGDPGADIRLHRFARSRRSHNTAVMSAMDGFHFGFAFGGPLRAGLRSLGMDCAQRSGPFKRAFIRRGSGLAGDLPPLARPQPAL